MRFVRYVEGTAEGLAIQEGSQMRGLLSTDAAFPGTLDTLISGGAEALAAAGAALRGGRSISGPRRYLPPFTASGKIICVGLNYRDHSSESGYEQPTYPTVFGRFASSLIGHGAPIVRPRLSQTLDFEGELVAVIGRAGTKISERDALDHVAGYSIFNDGSIREYQHLTPQWTIGKNFDGTGAFGPSFVTADELPAGCLGLGLETRLNGQVMQRANIDDMVFSVAQLVSLMSTTMTLQPGDLIVTGTPAGVGGSRKPPVFMKPGDVCEVEIERLGILANDIVDEPGETRVAA